MTAVQKQARADARPWTDEETALARQLRQSGLLWSAVGEKIGRDGAACRQRFTRVLREPDPLTGGDRKPTPKPKAPPMAKPTLLASKVARGPMDAGDPVSWGAITAGTLLVGCTYRAGAR